jgi:hypothetical protein
MSRSREVLAQIRMFAGDNRHFQENIGTLETARRLGIWYQVRKFLTLRDAPTNKVDKKIADLLMIHPDLRDLMSQYMSMCEVEYENTLATGEFMDGTGATWLHWCLKSFGERLDNVFDPRSS